MTTIEIKDASGKKAGSADLAATVFGIEPNMTVMHTVVRSQRAAWRQGTSNTLTRGQVRGGGKKPWRQKGTGRARVNNKEVKLAMRSALSAKLADGELVVVKDFEFEKPSTKAAVAAMKALGLEGRVALVIADDAVNTYLSFRNIPKVNIIPVSDINTYELIDNKKLVVTADALKYIEEVLA